MTNQQLIIEVNKRKYLIIISAAVIFFISYFVQSRVLQTFQSTSRFIVNETDITDLTGPSQFMKDFVNTNDASVNRLFRFAYSSEMMNYLIKKFRLYDYYQIDKSSEFAYERIVEKFSTRIKLKKTEENIIEITVTDLDRYQAAAIANEMAYKLNLINENYVKSQLRRKISLYGTIYADVKQELEADEKRMLPILDKYKDLITIFEKNKTDYEAANMKYSVIEMSRNLQNKREELIKTKQIYSTLLNTMEKEHIDTITIINIAQPDFHTNTLEIVVGSFFFSLMAICALILFLNFYVTHKENINILFRK